MAEKKMVGIDLTSREIRIVQVTGSRAGMRLEKFAIGAIPAGAIQGGRIADPHKLSEAIRELIKGNRFTAKKCVLGISGKYGVTRMISLPKMTMAQTRDAIMLQLNQYVPFPPQDALYDFKLMRELKEEGSTQNEILLAATRRSTVQPFINLLKRAGLTVVGIKLTTLASYPLFEDAYKDADQATAFIDVRDTVTDIFFIAENNFRLARSVEFGFNIIIDKARQKLGKTAEETREHLYHNKVDLMASYRGPADEEAAKKKVYDQDLKEVRLGEDFAGAEVIFEGEEKESPEKLARDSVLRAMSAFVNELMRSIRYFESQQKRRSRVGKIIVFGNIGMLEGLDDYLAEQTGYDVTVVDRVPLANVTLDATELNALADHEGEVVTALGLAYEAIRAKKIELNLLPRETMVRRKAYSGLKFGVIALIVVIALMATLYINKNKIYNEAKAEVDDLNKKINIVTPDYTTVQQLKTDIQGIKFKFGGLVQLTGTQVPWPIIMDELGRIMRDSVWIKKFSYDANGRTFEIEGSAFKTTEFQRFLWQIFESKVFTGLVLEDKKMENQPQGGGAGANKDYRPSTSPRIGGPRRYGIDGPPGYSEESAELSGEELPAVGPRATGPGGVRYRPNIPEPRYKLPEGPSGWRSIEDFYAGTLWVPDILWSFKISGTVNADMMLVGKTVFGDKVEAFFQTAGTGTGTGKPTPGGPKPGSGATPGAPPGGSSGSTPSPTPGG